MTQCPDILRHSVVDGSNIQPCEDISSIFLKQAQISTFFLVYQAAL
jgi:hypothetical protein